MPKGVANSRETEKGVEYCTMDKADMFWKKLRANKVVSPGERLILNEFVAYVDLGKIGNTLDPRSFVIATYALCGFANLSSVAIQVGGIGALAPSRKSDLARLGLKAMAAGTMANFMSACIAGMLL